MSTRREGRKEGKPNTRRMDTRETREQTATTPADRLGEHTTTYPSPNAALTRAPNALQEAARRAQAQAPSVAVVRLPLGGLGRRSS